MELQGKVVVVTGASRGIGRALSIALARAGSKLLLTAFEQDELTQLTEYLASELGVPAASMAADLADKSDRQRLLDWIRTGEQPPDILINNAGAGNFGRFASSHGDDIERTLQLNIHVPTILTRELLPVLSRRPQAKIVNISSGIARQPYPGLATYGAAKGYLSSFSESLAGELAGSSVSVLCFHPGFTDTHFMATAGMDMSKVPKLLVRTPETVAARIVRAIRKDKAWVYGDFSTRLGVFVSSLLPHRVKTRLFRNLFWRLPDET